VKVACTDSSGGVTCKGGLYRDLDNFIENDVKPSFEKGKTRRVNPEYNKYMVLKSKSNIPEEKKRLRELCRSLPSHDPMDPNFRRL
jgi:hypothetical protein